jgi:site-specific DNA recombinase
MKKVIGYVRVSSEMQKIKENSINNQLESIKDYCKRYEYDLIDTFRDEAISGLVKDREGLNNLIKSIKKNNIECIIVYSLSRLGRKLSYVLEFVDYLNKNNIKFISVKENFNTEEITGRLMLNLLGSINEFEIDTLASRISDVKQYKKSKDEVYTGKILYGMYKRGKKLIKNVSELNNLKLIVKLRDVEELSYGKIANYLNENKIKSKEKKQWYPYSVRSVYLNGCKEKFIY